MSKPIVSISVPEKDQKKFKAYLPTVLANAGDGRPMKLSKLVQKVILDSYIMDKVGLQNFTGKEALTSRDKYLVVILD